MVPQIAKGVAEEGVSLDQSKGWVANRLGSFVICDLRAIWCGKEWVEPEVELEDINTFGSEGKDSVASRKGFKKSKGNGGWHLGIDIWWKNARREGGISLWSGIFEDADMDEILCPCWQW